MPIAASINFRGTLGYVTDGAGQTYCLVDAYPTVRAGLTFGWTVPANVGGADRDSAPPRAPEFAGLNYGGPYSGGLDFQLGLPGPGAYAVRLALGDFYAPECCCSLYDGPTGSKLATVIAGGNSGAAGQYYDATGVLRTSPDDWRANNAAAMITTTGSALVVRIADTADGATGFTALVHLEVADAGDTTPPTLAGAAVPSAGTTLTATLSESGCTPASGTGGFTLGGTHATVASWAISGTTLTLTLARKVYLGQTVTLSYSRAATTNDIADAAGNFLADFAGAAVTNGSTQRRPVLLIGVG